MKIRSLILGSVVLGGLSTTGYAADLGVVTSLDVCDELGLSGLTISSDDNCLVITGEVTYQFSWGDYDNANGVDAENDIRNVTLNDFGTGDGGRDWDSNVTAKLGFVATASSDFGPASAHITLKSEDGGDFFADEAYVQIGDTTVIMAGLKGSIFADGDDAPLNWLGLFNSSNIDAGVGGRGWLDTGGQVIQVVSNLGNGLSIGGGLEDLDSDMAAVGVLKYAGDNLTAHASFAIDDISTGGNLWEVHTGVAATMDNFKFVAAAYLDNYSNGNVGDMYYNVLASASATFDMFTIAASFEADGDDTGASQWGAGGSVSATVSEGVTLNLGGRYWLEDGGDEDWQAAVGVTAAVTETITATAEVGMADDSWSTVTYVKGSLAWAPGGGFTSSVAAEANSDSEFKATFKAAKSFK